MCEPPAHLTSHLPCFVLVFENLCLKGFEEKHEQKVSSGTEKQTFAAIDAR